MRRLLVLRHAKTERDSPSGLDRDRRLDARGRQEAPMIGRYMREHALVPDLALISPAVRTRETFELLGRGFESGINVDVVGDLYGADAREVLQIVRTASGRSDDAKLKTILVVGHNPGLHELSLLLTGTSKPDDRADLEENLPTSGLVVLDFDVDEWNAISFRHGSLNRFITPRRLKIADAGD